MTSCNCKSNDSRWFVFLFVKRLNEGGGGGWWWLVESLCCWFGGNGDVECIWRVGWRWRKKEVNFFSRLSCEFGWILWWDDDVCLLFLEKKIWVVYEWVLKVMLKIMKKRKEGRKWRNGNIISCCWITVK